jgi:hypothetical protein
MSCHSIYRIFVLEPILSPVLHSSCHCITTQRNIQLSWLENQVIRQLMNVLFDIPAVIISTSLITNFPATMKIADANSCHHLQFNHSHISNKTLVNDYRNKFKFLCWYNLNDSTMWRAFEPIVLHKMGCR